MKCIPPSNKVADIHKLKNEYAYTPDLDELSQVFHVLGASNRLKICHLLLRYKSLCVCDLAEILSLSVPATSQHLAKLKIVGLLKTRREMQTIYYEVTDHPIWGVLKTLILECENFK